MGKFTLRRPFSGLRRRISGCDGCLPTCDGLPASCDGVPTTCDALPTVCDGDFRPATGIWRFATVFRPVATPFRRLATANELFHRLATAGKSGRGLPQSKTRSVDWRLANRAKRRGVRQSSGAFGRRGDGWTGWPARGTASRSSSRCDFFSTKFLTRANSKNENNIFQI